MVTRPQLDGPPSRPHPLFNARVGGRLSLDFVNTVRARVGRAADDAALDYQDVILGERLTTYAVLVDWAGWTHLVSADQARRLRERARTRPRDAAAVHARALRLREAIYRLGKASLEGWSPLDGDLAVVNDELGVARAHRVLGAPTGTSAAARRRGARGLPYKWRWAAGDVLDAVLWPIVMSAADMLASADVARLGQCPAAGCGWLFIDTSRSGRRQWCDMAVCGNAEKVRRFRERQQQRAAGGRRRSTASS